MQLSLFYDYESIYKSSSFFQKYETLFLAVEAVTDEQTLRKSTGRLGYGPVCFLKALNLQKCPANLQHTRIDSGS